MSELTAPEEPRYTTRKLWHVGKYDTAPKQSDFDVVDETLEGFICWHGWYGREMKRKFGPDWIVSDSEERCWMWLIEQADREERDAIHLRYVAEQSVEPARHREQAAKDRLRAITNAYADYMKVKP